MRAPCRFSISVKALVFCFFAALVAACAPAQSEAQRGEAETREAGSAEAPADDRAYYSAWTVITVGVADLDVALSLWVDEFGFNIVSRKDGGDADLARLWGLAPEDISRQALVRTGDAATGMIHFVEFNDPDPPVRRGANNYDLTPKNLDIYVRDIPQKVMDLKAKGERFRTDEADEFHATDGTVFREIHMLAHDDINVVMLEVVGEEKAYSHAGVAGIGPFVFIVPEAEIERDYFKSIFLVDKLNDNVFKGPEIEKTVGLPKGTELHISIWGREGFELGELEVIEYKGVSGDNLYPKAKPKALGILHIGYVVPDAAPLVNRLKARGVPVTHHGKVSTLIAEGEVISFASPAGLTIEVYER